MKAESREYRKQMPESDPLVGAVRHSKRSAYESLSWTRPLEERVREYESTQKAISTEESWLARLKGKEATQRELIAIYAREPEKAKREQKELEELAVQVAQSEARLSEKRHLAYSLVRDPISILFQSLFFTKSDSPIFKHVSITIGRIFSNLGSFEEIYEGIKEERLPEGTLYTALKEYMLVQEKIAPLFKEYCEKASADFAQKVREAVAQGELPSLAEQHLGRLADVYYRYVDFWEERLKDGNSLNAFKSLGSAHGSGCIEIASSLFEKSAEPVLLHVLFHEFFHLISGKSISLSVAQREEAGRTIEIPQEYQEVKSGTLLHGTRFRWLDEAVTEHLAKTFSGERGEGMEEIYTEECAELERLFSKGLSRAVVLDAYFEDITTETDASARAQKFALLVKEINRIEGEAGMNRLENTFRIKEAMRALLGEVILLSPIEESAALLERKTDFEGRTRQACSMVQVDLSTGNEKHPQTHIKRSFVFLVKEAKVDILPLQETLQSTLPDTSVSLALKIYPN